MPDIERAALDNMTVLADGIFSGALNCDHIDHLIIGRVLRHRLTYAVRITV